ncbi:MAG: T9SS type A sorting domain-containing protein [Salibacteraceae bacterium]
MKKLVHLIIVIFLTGNLVGLHAQSLVSVTDLGFYSRIGVSFLGLTNPEYDLNLYKVTYNTIDLNGNSTIASGMIAVPINPNCDSVPIALYGHGVVANKQDVPSRDNFEATLGKAIATRGFVTAMPDYLGLGDNPGLHPFQHAESEAQVSIDIIRAAKELITDSLSYTFNNQIFISGYSQGGHTAMATHKYIEDNNLESEFNIVASTPLSGAFHASSTQARVLLDDMVFGNQGFVVYMIMAYQEVYGGIYNTPSDFLQSPYDVTIPPLLDGTHDLSEINDSLPNQASLYLNPTFLANFLADSSTQTSAMWQALLDNDNYDWKPNKHLKMFYCRGDESVFPENSENAYDAMVANGANLVFKEDLGNASHTGCIVGAINNSIEFFQSVRPACDEPASTNSLSSSHPNMMVYPNPGSNHVSIKFENVQRGQIEICNLSGQVVFSRAINSTAYLNVRNWTEGIYLIRLITSEKTLIKKLIIKH